MHLQADGKSCSHEHLLKDILSEHNSEQCMCAECGYLATYAEFQRIKTFRELKKVKVLHS